MPFATPTHKRRTAWHGMHDEHELNLFFFFHLLAECFYSLTMEWFIRTQQPRIARPDTPHPWAGRIKRFSVATSRRGAISLRFCPCNCLQPLLIRWCRPVSRAVLGAGTVVGRAWAWIKPHPNLYTLRWIPAIVSKTMVQTNPGIPACS